MKLTQIMKHHLVIDTSMTELESLPIRSTKYVTCLRMVRKVLVRELKTDFSIELFDRLGLVAGFIDQHLDELSHNEQNVLFSDYHDLFNLLWEQSYYILFKHEICSFVDRHNFVFNCEALYLKDLFLFIQYCKATDIKKDIYNFGQTIIHTALRKHSASTTESLVRELQNEGEAVIQLLRVLLDTKVSSITEFEKTLSLLTELEHILNLADDALDVKSDMRQGLINPELGPLHQLKMHYRVIKQIIKTIVLYPLKTMYYAPRLTWYFILNTI